MICPKCHEPAKALHGTGRASLWRCDTCLNKQTTLIVLGCCSFLILCFALMAWNPQPFYTPPQPPTQDTNR